MNEKKYRFCLMLLIVLVLAGSVFYYVSNQQENKVPADGILVKNMELVKDECVS